MSNLALYIIVIIIIIIFALILLSFPSTPADREINTDLIPYPLRPTLIVWEVIQWRK